MIRAGGLGPAGGPRAAVSRRADGKEGGAVRRSPRGPARMVCLLLLRVRTAERSVVT